MRRKWSVSKFLVLLLLLSAAIDPAFAQETARTEEKRGGFLPALIPDGAALQFAGNIGMFSAGPVWHYGRHSRWETQLLAGFVPGKEEIHGSATFTIKQNLAPWLLPLSYSPFPETSASISPAVFSVSYNMITGESFWHQHGGNHDKYNYYQFSTRGRFSLGAGSRLNLSLPHGNRLGLRDVSLYYELSSYDLAIRYAICNKSVGLFDILSLGIGVQIRFL